MRVSECMTRDVRIASPSDTIGKAAQVMASLDAGSLPVGDNDRLVGFITDRDIAIRAIAEGKGPEAKVGDIMSREIRWCYEDEDVDDVLINMGELRVRRLPVLDKKKRLVGIVALADLAGKGRQTASALSHISQRGGLHSQTTH
ncbi:MAG TPA: CBS domain-containing protein [Phenylobacterium sp.]|nr:CBS domain-containing protein [Phenylobacterium sp.]